MAEPTTGWQVLDNVVKIGLGGIVGAIGAYAVARLNNKAAIQKLKFERRSKILSDAAQQYEDFFQTFLRISNLLHGMAGAAEENPQLMGTPVYSDFILKKSQEVVELRKQLALEDVNKSIHAQSQLMLLGEQKCFEAAQEFHGAVIAADMAFKFNGQTCDFSAADGHAHQVRTAREAFYKELQQAFDKA